MPEPSFNHAIVGVELSWEHVPMDPTAETPRTCCLLRVRPGYLLPSDGDTPLTTPIMPPENLMRVKTTGTKPRHV